MEAVHSQTFHQKKGDIDRALSEYKSLDRDKRTDNALNEMLRLCLITKAPFKMMEISEDILYAIESRRISPILLLKVLRKTVSPKTKTPKTLQIINRILMHWDPHSMDIDSKLLLIDILGQIGDHKFYKSTLALFESISHFDRTAEVIGVTMNCLMKMGRYRESKQ